MFPCWGKVGEDELSVSSYTFIITPTIRSSRTIIDRRNAFFAFYSSRQDFYLLY